MLEELPLKFRRAEWERDGFVKLSTGVTAIISADGKYRGAPCDLVQFDLFGYNDQSMRFDGTLEISIHPFYRVEGA